MLTFLVLKVVILIMATPCVFGTGGYIVVQTTVNYKR